MRFLIVEDVPIMRRVIANALRTIGYNEYLEAEDGSEALNLLEKEKIDFVITDWLMPIMDGLELARQIRMNQAYRDLPIIMLTTKGNKTDVVKALDANINDYIVKPFKASTLEEKIDEILSNFKTYYI